MADIAEAAGISRATLYVHFKDKDALLLALADNLVRASLQQMRDAWQPDAAFGANLEATILAKDLPLHRLKHTSPHGGELFDSRKETVAACGALLEIGFVEYLNSRAADEAKSGRRVFEIFGGAEAFGGFVAQAASGFKNTIATEDAYRAAIETFAALVESGTLTRSAKTRR